ncbi:alpha/beta fold hydrolase [Aestuariicella hydrocarbonica]|uniref:Alpha/beta fold hydrolase n=2 Tax=Pseudomaricurvus hydrocarbonicus TaxID=1470433 RepID=A0A9E5JSL2_9GAMM|nr:alpha/beta fold hydrolase [Aestuariicella hydrocarbonica]
MGTLMTFELLHTVPEAPVAHLLLAHGAGAPMDSEFMDVMARLLVERNIGVVRFEFPYMQQRRHGGSKRPPDRQPVLLEAWRQVVEQCSHLDNVFIGGKSMGGRMASLIADEMPVKGCVCLGYPFHPPAKPEKTRTEHLRALAAPTLIVQGTRDALGKREEVEQYDLSRAIGLCWLEDGDHDFKPRVRSGLTQQQHLISAADAVADFISGQR